MTNIKASEAIAVSHFLVIEKLIERARDCVKKEEEKKKVGKPLRSRLREAPSIMLSTGASGLLTFYLSKSDNNHLPTLIQLFTTSASISTSGEAERLIDDTWREVNGIDKKVAEELIKDKGGYTIALAMILSYLSTLGLCTCTDKETVANTASFTKNLLEKPGLDAAVSRLLLPYLESAKRLIEAIVKGGEE